MPKPNSQNPPITASCLKAMGTNVFIVAECTNTVHGNKTAPLSTRPVMTEAQWKTFTTRLTKLAELLKADGFQLAYHHHMGTVVQTAAEIDRLMAGNRRGGEPSARYGPRHLGRR